MKIKKDKVYSIYKVSNFLYKKRVPIIPNILMRYIRLRFSCYLPFTASLEEGVRFGHNALGVVVHEQAVIGQNTKIYQNVTIGGRNGSKGCPIIGKNVFIGAGAVLLGDIQIGDNAMIGANAVVLDSVPPNCTAVGVPARIINKNTENIEICKVRG